MKIRIGSTTMRFPKVSLKRCFLFTVAFAVLLLFGFTLREKDLWTSRTTQHQLLSTKTQQNPEDPLNAGHLTKNPTTTAPSLYEDYDKTHDSDNSLLPDGNGRPWYFSNGVRYPHPARINRKTKKRVARLMPYEDSQSDRITNQLMFMPPNYEEIVQKGTLKTILLYNGLGPWNVRQGRDIFLHAKCPINTCTLTANRDHSTTADMLLFKDHYISPGVVRKPHQIYMLYFLECPYHTQNIKFPSVFNWTATYRKDSDIVAPYEKWEYFDPRVKQVEQDKNYALNKTKKVAWFVSNCGARNGRLQYAHDLQKHIQVDIYGACGTFKCSRSTSDLCFELLDNDYKFYLAFENSNCKDYITEKFFVNALYRNVLPIVMGARPEDYLGSAPYKSYIHVDDFASPKELAAYLHLLDKNDELYNSYFKWKGTGEFINTYFWCRVCAMLHDEAAIAKPKWYPDINDWWRGKGVCTSNSWRIGRHDVMSDD
ncbi:glycoprotein 3-alpha-L-fucosyltransferase A [Lutzomyia longipalpis]|uniref:Fucosyltransferase n=2 Tax=Lutzomyia longipalpis TaxID=7200 RepID=A0A1B0CTS6_LUTLO|nr:glycoprotein 3-alpha-L-fucosyltransferase A [Lutzomyia longipalpis]